MEHKNMNAWKVAGTGALGLVLACMFPRVRLELDVLRMRAGYSMLRCEGGSWWATQKEIQFVLSLERTRRLDGAITHVDTGRGSGGITEGNGKRLVLIGGGHSHAYTLKDFYTNPISNTEVVLITKTPLTPYSGMLPGYIAGVYTFEECHLNLVSLCQAAGIKLILAEATHIDTDSKTVTYKADGSQGTCTYDVLSIDIGSTPRCAIDSKKVIPVKPIDSLDMKWRGLLDRIVTDVCNGKHFALAVVGSGGSGAEMTLSMEARLVREITAKNGDPSLVDVMLVSKSGDLLPNHCKAARGEMAKEYARRGITVVHGEAASTTDDSLIMKDGGKVKCDACLWCTDAGTGEWLRETKLELEDGFVKVNQFMQSTSHGDVYAAGDCASLPARVAKAGVFAVREGPPLTANLKGHLVTPTPPPVAFVPPTSFLGLFGTGYPGNCVASRGTMATSAGWLWDLKDWIDRAWMAQYTL